MSLPELDARALCLAGALGGLLVYLAQRGWRRMRLALRMRHARAGERAAEHLLERAGYRIEGRQVSATLAYRLDGDPVAIAVRADLLVRRRGRRYVAEIKTGRTAPKLTTSATRRQLLEYAHAFDTRGLLLVDMERRTIQVVEVPHRERRGWLARWLGR